MFYSKKISVLTALIAAVSVVLCSVFSAGAVRIASEGVIFDEDDYVLTSVMPAVTGDNLEIKAKSAILMDAKSGTVLYEKNADEALPPASITKIMSLLLVAEAIDSKRLSLDEKVTSSAHAASMGGSQIWLEENEVMTVDELLKASFIASANDTTVALAEKLAGSEESFVALMNEKAKALGMNSTHFENATGLDAEGHLSSAHDIAVMSRELIAHDFVKNYSTVWMDTLRNGETELVNTNKLVRFYEGATGLKTGTTDSAGYCLSATAERDGLSLVAVIMAGESSAERFAAARKLLDFGFANYICKSVTPVLSQKTATVKDGESETVELSVKENVDLLLLKSDASELKQKTVLKNKITAPVKSGERLGAIEIYKGDELVYTLDITAKSAVERKKFLSVFLKLLKGIFVI